jgi:DNA topoisomerase-2
MKIMGLQMGKKYITREDLQTLRYGSIMIMTDQDHDGSHIKGLLINFIHFFWPDLIMHHKEFLKEFITPIIKVTKNGGGERIAFFTIPEYEKWAEDRIHENTMKDYRIKYYKGLGTSTSLEAKEYFKAIEKHRIRFFYKDANDDDAIDLAFNKKKADYRKEWLSNYNPKIFVDHNLKDLRLLEFINKELIHFSNADNLRSIPSVIDGFKPGQRKILFACFKRFLR